MPRTHLAFRRIARPVVQAAEDLFTARPWRVEDTDEQAALGQTFLDAVVAAYNVPAVELFVSSARGSSDYRYTPAVFEADSLDDEPRLIQNARIMMQGWSIVTLFHAARNHVLAQGGAEPVASDPVGWGHSLFYLVRPKMFRARVREGRVMNITARDTFSADSWEKLSLAGFTFGDRLVGSPAEWGNVLGIELAGTSGGVTVDVDELPDEDEYDSELSDEELAEIFGEVPTEEPAAEMFEVVAEGVFDAETDTLTMTPDVDALNRDELRKLAAELELPGRGSMNAPALREALRDRLAAQ